MRPIIAILFIAPWLLTGCGQQTRYPERPATQATQADPNDPIVSGKPLSSWLKDFKSPDAETRRSACVYIANKGATYAIKPLIGALKDSDPAVRYQAARSLGTVGKDKEALPALIAALRDPDDKVKVAAGEAVAEYKFDATAAVPALVEMWGSKNGDVKVTAGRALNAIDVDAARKAGVPAP